MRTTIFFLFFISIAYSASAQFVVNNQSTSHSASSTTTPQTTAKGVIAWHYVEAGYTWSHLANTSGGYDRNFNVGDLGYRIAFNISPRVPLALETGLGFSYGTSKNVQYNVVNKPLNVDYKISYLTLPVTVSYRFDVNNSISLMPSAGMYARYYLSASSNSYSDDPDVRAAYEYLGIKFGVTDLLNQGYSNLNWKRFGCGLQVGVDAVILSHIRVGINYQYQFTETNSMIGYKFTHAVNIVAGWVFN